MQALKIASIFVAAVFGEVGGAYAIWRWRRMDASAWLVPVGIAALFGYALVQTFQPEVRFGRLFAAYAGVFLLGAMTWGVVVDGWRPDRFDLIGAGLVIAGIATILGGRSLFA